MGPTECHIRRTEHPTATTTPPAGVGKTPARSPQDHGRHPGRPPRLTPCPTVYFLQCPTTAPPRFGGEDDDFHVPLLMYAAPPCDYKRGRRASFKGGCSGHQGPGHPHSRSSSPLSTTEHTLQLIPPLTETWEHPSFSRLTCTPLQQALRVHNNTVPSHTPLLDVVPRGRNQDKPVRSWVTSCINHPERETT